jgi:hypothetical protein
VYTPAPERLHLQFGRKGNHYVRNFTEEIARTAAPTIAQNESIHTKREVRDAREARVLSKRLGYPAERELTRMIHSGGLYNSPVTAEDVHRATHIYGKDIAALKGKSVQQKPLIIKVEYIAKMVKQHQTMHADLMFIDNLPFVVSVLEPLGLTITSPLASKSEAVLTQEMFNHLNVTKSQQFIVSTIRFDGERGVTASTYALQEQGYKLDIAGPDQHVPVIERKIRLIKERVRAILHSLPFTLPTSLLRYIVSNAVMGINMMPSLLRVDQTSPRKAFTGRKCDFKRDLRAAFGDYVQCP